MAPNVGPEKRDDGCDAGFSSGGALSTPADLQQSRRPLTREYSLKFSDAEWTSDDFVRGVGPRVGNMDGSADIAPRPPLEMITVLSATSRFAEPGRIQLRKTNAIACWKQWRMKLIIFVRFCRRCKQHRASDMAVKGSWVVRLGTELTGTD